MTTAAADALLAVQPVTRDDGQRATQALRSLFADGWTIQQLADTTGLTARTVGRTINGHTTPAPSSAAAIIEALDQLRFEDPGDSVASLQARYRGERAGWEPVTRPHPGPTSTTSPSTASSTRPQSSHYVRPSSMPRCNALLASTPTTRSAVASACQPGPCCVTAPAKGCLPTSRPAPARVPPDDHRLRPAPRPVGSRVRGARWWATV